MIIAVMLRILGMIVQIMVRQDVDRLRDGGLDGEW